MKKKLNDVEEQTAISKWMSIRQIKLVTAIIYIIFIVFLLANFVYYQILIGQFIIWMGIGIYMSIPFIIPGFMKINERYDKWEECVFLLQQCIL